MFNKKEKKLLYTTGTGYPGDGDWIDNCRFTRNFDEADILILEGGVDISCSLYGEKRGIYTQTGEELCSRDKSEINAYNQAVRQNKLIVGICRGMQLASVLNGAKLVQHMRHPNSHECKTFDGKICYTNSLHHQLVNPWHLPKEDYELLMYTEGLSNTYLNGNNEETEFPLEAFTDEGLIKEPEAIYFHKTKTFLVQFHPEMMSYNSWFWNMNESKDEIHTLDYLNKLIKEVYKNKNYFKELKLIENNG